MGSSANRMRGEFIKRPGDGNPLPFPAAELVGFVLQPVVHSKLLKHSFSPFPQFSFRERKPSQECSIIGPSSVFSVTFSSGSR